LLELRYQRLGEAFLDEVRGNFAVALYDPARRLSIVARDGMGNVSLSYVLNARIFAASQDEALLANLSEGAFDFEPLRLATFYAAAELAGPETFFSRVRALLPGEMLLVGDREVRRRSLARPRADRRLRLARWEEYVEALGERLAQSVRRSLEGVNEVAVLTSGGLDSPPLAALAARELSVGGAQAAVTALSWRVSDPAADEPFLVEAVARKAGIPLEWIDCEDALPFSGLALWPVHPSTPEQTAYRWFHQRSYRRAQELGLRYFLSGFGGDPLHSYGRRWAWDLLAAQGPGAAIDRLREVSKEVGWRRTLRSEVLSPLLPPSLRRQRRGAPFLEAKAIDRLATRSVWPPEAPQARRPRQAERLLSLIDASGGNIERFYTEPFGLEQRTPLRDFDLVQFMLSVPDHLLQQGREKRPALRAAIRGLVPEEVRSRRRKSGFLAAIERGLAPERMRWTRSLLLDPDALWRGYIKESAVRSWVDSSPTDNWGKMGYLHAIYGELWRRERAGLPRPSADAVD
jgi:asparagine synthase (glutamine-hydrolysing)